RAEMPNELSCPSCGKALRIAPGTDSGSLTCPHCLGPVEASAASRTIPEAELVAGETCPWCHSPVQSGWSFCPTCQARLRATARAPRYRYADLDVGQDTKQMSWGFMVLAVFGSIVSILYIFAATEFASETYGTPGPLIGILILLG